MNIGNPHLIFFSEVLDAKLLESDAKKILQGNVFPEGVNISVVKINSEKRISLINSVKSKNFFDNYLNSILIKTLPNGYLENFDEIVEYVLKTYSLNQYSFFLTIIL